MDGSPPVRVASALCGGSRMRVPSRSCRVAVAHPLGSVPTVMVAPLLLSLLLSEWFCWLFGLDCRRCTWVMVVVLLVVLVVVIVVVVDSVAQRLGLGLPPLGARHDPRHGRGRDRGFARSWKSGPDTILVVVVSVSVMIVMVVSVIGVMMMMMMMVVMEVVVEMVVMVVTVLVVWLVQRRRVSIATYWTRIPSTTTTIGGLCCCWWSRHASFQCDTSGARLERARYRFASQRVAQSQSSSRRKRHDWTTNGRWWWWAGDVIQFANGCKRAQSRNSGPRLGQWPATARPMCGERGVEWPIPWCARATRRKTTTTTRMTTTKRNDGSCEEWLGLEWWWLRPWLWPSALIVPGGESLYCMVLLVYISTHTTTRRSKRSRRSRRC